MSEQQVYVRKALSRAAKANLPTNKDDFAKIGNPLRSNGQGNILGAADEILDLAQGKFQDEINAELRSLINGTAGNLAAYQKKLKAGNGIKIDDATNTISTTLDLTLYRIVSALPDVKAADLSRIYLVADAAGNAADQNVYTEYIVVSTDGSANTRKWEKLGQYKSNVDLSPYLKKTDAENTYFKKVDVVKSTDGTPDTSVQNSKVASYARVAGWVNGKVNTADVLKAADSAPTTDADRQKKVVSYERFNNVVSGRVEKSQVIYNDPANKETGDDAKLPTVAKVNSLISTKVGTVYRPKGSVADKAALYALTGVKVGDVYNVVAAVSVPGVGTFPKATNFVALVDHAATTDANFAAYWDSLGGMFDQSFIDRMWKIIISNHAYASIKVNSGLTNGIIEKGVSTKLNIGWIYGISGDNAKPNIVKVQKSPDKSDNKTFTDWTNGLNASAMDDTISDYMVYKVLADFGNGITKQGTVTVTARYPIYVVCSPKQAIFSSDIVQADGDNHKKYLLNNPGSGTTFAVKNAVDDQYVWVCVPADMTMTDAKMGGQPFSFEAAVGVTVNGKGTYRCYRSKWAQNAGQLSFQVWGGNTTETPPTPKENNYSVTVVNSSLNTTSAPQFSSVIKDAKGAAVSAAPTALKIRLTYDYYKPSTGREGMYDVATNTTYEYTYAKGAATNNPVKLPQTTGAAYIRKVEVLTAATPEANYISTSIENPAGIAKLIGLRASFSGTKAQVDIISGTPAGNITVNLAVTYTDGNRTEAMVGITAGLKTGSATVPTAGKTIQSVSISSVAGGGSHEVFYA